MNGCIGVVTAVAAIPGADRIQSVTVICGRGGKWRGVASKALNVEDKCEVFLPDCLLPQTPRFEFMKTHGYRVKMMRFKGVASECLIMPLADETCGLEIGTSLDEIYGLQKYEKTLPMNNSEICGPFTDLISKTNEPNYQTVPEIVAAVFSTDWQATVKYDGSSLTVVQAEEGLRVFSRNYEIRKGNNWAWNIAQKYDMQKNIPPGNILQMEAIGPGIQKNPLGLESLEARVFNWKVWGADDVDVPTTYMLGETLFGIPCAEIHLIGSCRPTVPEPEELLSMANFKYANGRPAEGLVFRPFLPRKHGIPTRNELGERLSFKVINLNYER